VVGITRNTTLLTLPEERQTTAFDGKPRKRRQFRLLQLGGTADLFHCVGATQVENRRSLMKSKMLTSVLRVFSLLWLVAGGYAFAQEFRPTHFSGLINDYSPLSTSVKGSPWEMHGQWSMDVHPEWGTADFLADMTMSGFGMTSSGA
jgi:hypothetical protein